MSKISIFIPITIKDKTNVDDFFEDGTDAEKSRFVA